MHFTEFHEIIEDAIQQTEATKKVFHDRLEVMYANWRDAVRFSNLPLIDQTTGQEILRLLEEHEPYQHSQGMYDDKFCRWQFYKTVYEQACNDYPMAMKRAESQYFHV